MDGIKFNRGEKYSRYVSRVNNKWKGLVDSGFVLS